MRKSRRRDQEPKGKPKIETARKKDEQRQPNVCAKDTSAEGLCNDLKELHRRLLQRINEL